MIALVAVLLSAAPAVRALPNADVVTVIPSLSATSSVLPFFEAAGSRTALLQPGTWREASHPLVAFDVFRPESMTRLGIDVSKELTLSRRDTIEVSCLSLTDTKKFQAEADQRLARVGTIFKKTIGGVSIVASRDQLNRVTLAYGIKGAVSCAAVQHQGSLEKQLGELAQLISAAPKAPVPAAWLDSKSPVIVLRPDAKKPVSLSLTTKGLSVKISGRSQGLPLLSFAGAGATPFAPNATEGIAYVRLRIDKKDVANGIQQLLAVLPQGKNLTETATALAPLLTGNCALLLHKARIGAQFRTPEARFFSMKAVLMAETTDAAAAEKLVAAIPPEALVSSDGKIQVGVMNSVVFITDDAAARDVGLLAIGSSNQQAHSVEWTVTPPAISKTLSQIPLLQIVQNPQLAPVLAVSTEIGPLLSVSEPSTGFLERSGTNQHVGEVTWSLKPSAFSTDAGTIR